MLVVAHMEHAPRQRTAEFRFYEELNDFLPAERRKRTFTYGFRGRPSVKDTIEAIGVPHTEVDLILVDGEPSGFDVQLGGGERVAVYPAFERLDISPVNRLRPEPLRNTRLILDVHLGKLARYLRLLGFDAAYGSDLNDETMIGRARKEERIILTRDKMLLKHGDVSHGHWLRSTDPEEQLREVVRALDLAGSIRPFTRCLECNSVLEVVAREAVLDRVPDDVAERFDEFTRCPECDRVYWRGSHFDRMRKLIASVR